MRMQVNSGVSENVESFSYFLHGREICFNQKKEKKELFHKRGRKKKYNSVAFVFCLLFACCCGKKKEKKRQDSKAVVRHSMNKTNLADFLFDWLCPALSSLVKRLIQAYLSPT